MYLRRRPRRQSVLENFYDLKLFLHVGKPGSKEQHRAWILCLLYVHLKNKGVLTVDGGNVIIVDCRPSLTVVFTNF